MEQRLTKAIVEGVGLSRDVAGQIVSAVLEWLDDLDDGQDTTSLRLEGILVTAKVEGEQLSLSIAESKNVAGASIVEPGSETYTVKIPLEVES